LRMVLPYPKAPMAGSIRRDRARPNP